MPEPTYRELNIDYLMFRDLAVGEVFTVTDWRSSWLFHGRGEMEKIATSDKPFTKWTARYLDNQRDTRTFCWVNPGYQVQRVAGPKGAPGTLHVHIVATDADIWGVLDRDGFDLAASGQSFVDYLEGYVLFNYPDAHHLDIVHGLVSKTEAHTVEAHSNVKVPEPVIVAHLKELFAMVCKDVYWEVEVEDPDSDC